MTISELLYTASAGLYLALAGLVVFGGRTGRTGRTDAALAVGCLTTSCWAISSVFSDSAPSYRYIAALDLTSSVVWYVFILCLYHQAVTDGSRLKLAFTTIGVLATGVVALSVALDLDIGFHAEVASFGSADVDVRLALAVCTILLIENLYRNASADERWHIALPCIAVCGLCIYEILFYGDAVLFRRWSPILTDGRPVLLLLTAPILALSVSRNRRRWGANIQVSRTVVLHTASLVVVGVFLLALAAVGEALRLLGSDRQGDWGMVIEVGLVCGGLLTAGVFLTSGSARSNLRTLVVDNFFAQRYDYRLEWLRCITTLSQLGTALHTRAIRAVGQIVDSPSGLLFLRDGGEAEFRWAGSWNLPPTTAQIGSEHPLPPLFRGGGWVVEASGERPWIEGMAELWLAVPLSHAGRLTGFALISRPRAQFVLDREVFDLLRIVGQEVASHVAEQQAAETLLQTRQLREYGQRFAFVAHDIKNVASQLSLLLSNAEHHINNPEFQKDMLGTVGGSVQKITSLLARLKTPEDPPAAASLNPMARFAALIGSRATGQRHRIRFHCERPEPAGGASGVAVATPSDSMIDSGDHWEVRMAATSFDSVIAHLLDNAFEASAAETEVRIDMLQEGSRLIIDIVDQGCGMSPEFIRDRLFHPFSTSKAEGFGLGVYQARELLREAGGDLQVTSTPGSGTTMHLSLPVVNPASGSRRAPTAASRTAAGASR